MFVKSIYKWPLLALLLSSCAATTPAVTSAAPAWLDTVNSHYPSDVYITGVSSADTIEIARQRAIGNLSQSIKVQVKSDISSVVEERTTTQGGARTSTAQTSVRDSSQLSSNLELPGAEIAKTTFDKNDGLYYALAVLKKSKLSDYWQEKANEFTKNSKMNLDQAKSNLIQQPLISYQQAKAAQRLFLVALDYHQNLGLLTVERSGKSASHKIDQLSWEIQNLLESSKNRVLIRLVSNGEQSDSMRSSVIEVMGEQGLRVHQDIGLTSADQEGQKHYDLIYGLQIQPAIFKDSFWRLLGQAHLELKMGDASLNKIVIPIRVSAANQGVLPQYLQKQLKEKISFHFVNLLCGDCPEELE